MYKILIADDEELIRALIAKYAKFEGYETEEARDGMEAVRKCAEENFDIVIMDIMMPGALTVFPPCARYGKNRMCRS